ncbi:MAG TPA: ABC-2 family transporter protein [Mycobacteriales bacterium]
MAEQVTRPVTGRVNAGMAGPVREYLLLVGMWTRASFQYPASLAILTLSQFVLAVLDLAAIAIVFTHTRSLAGFSLPEVMFLYGTSATAFALADLLVGNVERVGRHVRLGTFDVMLVRPASALAQVAAEDFSPRRLGKLCSAVPVLVIAVVLLPVDWTATRVLLLPVMVGAGAAIFAAVWVLCSAFQLAVGEQIELLNTFIYGGGFLVQYPLSLYGRDALRLLTWVFPLAFVNWQPALYVLGRPDPLGLPTAFRFASPVVATLLVALAAFAWRAGVRHYRSTGS